VVRALVLVAFLSDLRFKFPWVQTIFLGQPAGGAGVLPNSCVGGALHGSEVYPTKVKWPYLGGFFVIKKRIRLFTIKIRIN
jgi:hypothetical protein